MSNITSFSTDPFNIWLLENQWVVPFVRFDSPSKLNDTRTRQKRLSDTISKIHEFNTMRLTPSAPEVPHFPSISRSMIPSSVFLAHEHFFLQDKLFRTRCKSHQIALKRTKDLIEALETARQIESAMVIIFDEDALFRYLLADSNKSISIAEADSIIVSQISSDELILSDVNTQLNVLLHIITGMKPNYDRRALFLFDHPLQEKFDQLFYHSDFQFRSDIDILFTDQVMSTADMFTNATVRLMQQLTQYYKLTESTEVSIFSLIYFRAVYNYAISHKPDFFFRPDKKCLFHLYSDQISIQMTGASPVFLPKHEPGESLKAIVAKSDKLTNAARQISTLAFHITPLDLLAAIHSALTELRMFACEGPSSDDAQSFDTIFGLFLVVLVASDLPNQEQIFKFVLDFAPPDGLSGPLEYARATVSAASLQCQSILEGILEHGNGANE